MASGMVLKGMLKNPLVCLRGGRRLEILQEPLHVLGDDVCFEVDGVPGLRLTQVRDGPAYTG